jgi:peptidoglycan/LPS O-acetylase OafA/YrhL
MDTNVDITPPGRRLEWLDALRGWAILGVVLVHSGQVARLTAGSLFHITVAGQYGVQLFFVVSSLTIGLTYDSHIRKFGSGLRSDISWLTKRYFRIAPFYYLALVFYVIEQYVIYRAQHGSYGVTFHSGHTTSVFSIIANLLFINTWVPAAQGVVPGGFSISGEMMFYLLVPLIWLASRSSKRIKILAFAILPVLCISAVASKLVRGTADILNNDYFYYWFPTHFPVFAVGLICYFSSFKQNRTPLADTPMLRWSIALAVLVGGCICGTFDSCRILAPLITGIGFVFLAMCLKDHAPKIAVNRLTIFLGRVSFSIYLIHFFILDCIKVVIKRHGSIEPAIALLCIFPFVLVVASLISLLTKRFIEDPGIWFGHRLSSHIVAVRTSELDTAVLSLSSSRSRRVAEALPPPS